ncbi:unnamed protein product [Candidula unifasciata]|uniref:Allatotropin n=1 Tax=Candidula unifasciata TaxID=100452 RepID=A0A8S3Z5D7_9EUPU|nr:unnamed protein product [Candidula unifasciata]
MSSLQGYRCQVISLLLVFAICCLLTDFVTPSSVPVAKRETRRYPRAKYRVGYMFGKRSSSSETPSSSLLFDAISRNTMTKAQLENFILRNPEVLSEISTILDKNDDDYISLSDLL